MTFGSAPSCDLVLSDKTVSRKHVEAYLDGNQTIVRDLGSTNGTFIQGARFKEVALAYGAEVKLGDVVRRIRLRQRAHRGVDRYEIVDEVRVFDADGIGIERKDGNGTEREAQAGDVRYVEFRVS